MRINSEKLSELAALPDDRLWAEIVRMGKNFGYSIPERTPPHSDMERIRSAITGSKINLGDAMQLLRMYGKGGGK